MLFTREEARQQACPIATIANWTRNETAHCIADACMMWRWWGWEKYGDDDAPTHVGYCGLAGRPVEEEGP